VDRRRIRLHRTITAKEGRKMKTRSRVSPTGRLVFGLALGLVLLQSAFAAPNAVVEAVQMPAWVERSAGRVPLAPGMELENGDKVRTGANSRLLLRTADGSAVKLGENASLLLNGMQQQKDGVFVAALAVGEGAFRFTTDIFAKIRGKRLVNVSVATVTIGVRGTDLWGKSAPNRQVVCLIEGRIDVTPPGEQPINMDQALQFYVRDNDKSLPVAAVDAKQLAQWATETEVAAGAGAARRGGKWKVVLGTADTQADALKLYDDVRNAGYAAEIRPVLAGDKRSYNVRLANLPSRDEAQALAARLKGSMGVTEPRVSM
jgi:hypothetical protein